MIRVAICGLLATAWLADTWPSFAPLAMLVGAAVISACAYHAYSHDQGLADSPSE